MGDTKINIQLFDLDHFRTPGVFYLQIVDTYLIEKLDLNTLHFHRISDRLFHFRS